MKLPFINSKIVKIRELNFNSLKDHLKSLEVHEKNLWKEHNSNNLVQVLKIVVQRSQEIQLLTRVLAKLEKDKTLLNNHKHSDEIKIIINLMNELHQLLVSQVNLLSESKKLVDLNSRENIINGNKSNEHESETTTRFNELMEKFNNLSHSVVTLSEEIEHIKLIDTKNIKLSLNDKFAYTLSSEFDHEFAKKHGFIIDMDKGTIKCEIDLYETGSYEKTGEKKVIEFYSDLERFGMFSCEIAKEICKINGGELINMSELRGLYMKLLDIAKHLDVENIAKKIGLNFEKDLYCWSSTETSTTGAFYLYLGGGNAYSYHRTGYGYVVCLCRN